MPENVNLQQRVEKLSALVGRRGPSFKKRVAEERKRETVATLMAEAKRNGWLSED